MRYITNDNGYLLEVSFGADIECDGRGCTEYTGDVPAGYDSLADWFTLESDKLHRWHIVEEQLTLDEQAPEPKVFVPAEPYSVTTVWENASPTSAFAAQEISLDFSQYDAAEIELYSPTAGAAHPTPYTRFFKVLKNGTCCMQLTRVGGNIGGSIPVFSFRYVSLFDDHIGFGGHDYMDGAATQQIKVDNAALVPVRIYGIKFGEAIESEPESANLFDINNILTAARYAFEASSFAPKVENGVFYSGGKSGESAGAAAYVPVNAGDVIQFSATVSGSSGSIEVHVFPTPVNGIFPASTNLESFQCANASFEKTYTIPDGMNCFGFKAYADAKYGMQLTDIIMQKIN